MNSLNFRKQVRIISAPLICTFFIALLLTPPSVFSQDQNSISTLRQMGKAFAGIAEKASPAVVGVKAEKMVAYNSPFELMPFDPFSDDFFKHFFDNRRPPQNRQPQRQAPQRKYRQTAQGSGFIISSDGYILTNNHVVDTAGKILVKLGDKPEVEAKVIGTDPESDIAVIKIDANDLPTLELADSDRLEVGEWVIAIGNPFGLSHTVTAGIVSAKGRNNVGLAAYEDFIQTDAAINPGNSGGPLLNLDGKVVGINTAIVGSTGNIGIGLAIPVNMAKNVYEQLIASGTVSRGFLGVAIQDLTPELAESFGLKDVKGVLIPEVTKDSAADKAGIKHNDIVVEFNGHPVEKADEFRKRVAMLKPGTKAEIVILRDGQRQNIEVELGQRPKQDQTAADQTDNMEKLGFSVQDLTDELADQLGYKGLTGVVITEIDPESDAAQKGLAAGMLITEVNRQPVKDTNEFKEAIDKSPKGSTVLLLVKDKNSTRFVTLSLPQD